jgi:hypothetical protein
MQIQLYLLICGSSSNERLALILIWGLLCSRLQVLVFELAKPWVLVVNHFLEARIENIFRLLDDFRLRSDCLLQENVAAKIAFSI